MEKQLKASLKHLQGVEHVEHTNFHELFPKGAKNDDVDDGDVDDVDVDYVDVDSVPEVDPEVKVNGAPARGTSSPPH